VIKKEDTDPIIMIQQDLLTNAIESLNVDITQDAIAELVKDYMKLTDGIQFYHLFLQDCLYDVVYDSLLQNYAQNIFEDVSNSIIRKELTHMTQNDLALQEDS